jgi:hypothetical protein
MTRVLAAALLVVACGKQEGGGQPQPPPTAPATAPPPAKATDTPSSAEMGGERTDKPAQANPSGVTVAFVVDGAPRPAITAADLAKVKGMQVEGDSGEESRDAWSARDVAATLVGPGARITRVRGEDGKKDVELDAAAWKDATKVPILRINRRGLVKFFWATADGNPLVAGEVRGVTEIHASSK